MNAILKRLLLSCAVSVASAPLAGLQETAFAQSVDTSNWQSYGDTSSPVSMRFPPGWSATSDPTTGRIDIVHGGGARLSVMPFSVSNMTIEKLNPQQFFEMIIKAFAPNETWSPPQAVGTYAYRSTYTNATESAASAIVVSQNDKGIYGQICMARIPKGSESASNDELATILSSIKYNASADGANAGANGSNTGGADGAASEAVSSDDSMQNFTPQGNFAGWTKFTDPSEQSFYVDVPIGWKVDGGLTRYGALDVRPWVKVVSPDNLITAFIGDGKISPCTMPTAQGTALGFGAGSRYNGTLVQPYLPARQFVERYAKTLLKTFLTNVQVTEKHNHPDVALAVNGTVGATRSEAASIKLTGMYGSIPAVAYFLAVTKATVQGGTGMWWVTKIAGAVSPAERDAEGLAVVLHMLQTFEVNPAWQSNSLKNTMAVSQHYRQVSQQVSRSISDRYWSQQAHNDRMNQSYWDRQASQNRAANNFSNYIRGVENVRDADTGQNYQVQYGPASHYIDSGSN